MVSLGLGQGWGTEGRGWLTAFPQRPRPSPCQSKVCWAQGWKVLITQGKKTLWAFPPVFWREVFQLRLFIPLPGWARLSASVDEQVQGGHVKPQIQFVYWLRKDRRKQSRPLGPGKPYPWAFRARTAPQQGRVAGQGSCLGGYAHRSTRRRQRLTGAKPLASWTLWANPAFSQKLVPHH